MEQILIFLQNYYQLIICVLTFIVNLVIFIIKKRPSSAVFSELKLAILDKLPSFISESELLWAHCNKSGSVKKDSVSVLALEFSEKYLKRKLKDDEIIQLNEFISESIEKILDTPSKKGAL